MPELNDAFKKTKTGKEPGPDNIRMELLNWLSPQNRELLLETINVWWITKQSPKELYFAKVATIFKKVV